MTSFERQVAESTDDAYQSSVGATANVTNVSIVIANADQYAGFRFPNVTIPQGSTINSAYVDIVHPQSADLTAKMDLYCQLGNAAVFAAATNNISERTRTAASVFWNATVPGTGYQSSPSLLSIVQEAISHGGWVSGYALAVIMIGKTGANWRGRSYDSGDGQGAKLYVDYTAPSGGKPAIYYSMMR
jgi:hypothetical protein